MTVCEATHLTTFAGGMVVPPNTIDWDYVFSNFDFDRNPTLYGTEIVIFVAYILAVVWARRKDKKDLQKIGLAPLLDNYADDKYFYEIVVVTGMRRNAGTKSKVFFTLVGDREETDTREFSDDQRDIFQWGSVDGFLMSTTRSLGDLQWMRVWHDNSGQGEWGSWFLSHVTVRDVQTDKKWVFVANSWLAVEEGDGQISRVIPSGTNDQTADFSHTVSERCRRNLTDDHLWFSVVTRPPQSRFTRVQRVSCCLCLLLTSMLANAMFYRTDDDASETTSQTSVLRLGPFTLSPQQLFIGVVSNLIVFPVNLIIITLFRKARPRTKRPADVDKSASQADDNPEVVVSSPPKTTSLDANQPQRSISDGVREQSTPRAPPQLDNAKRGDKASSTDVGTTDPASAGAPPMLNEVNPSDISAAAGHEPQSTSGDPPPPAEGEKKKKKRKRGLPWWCRILAWILLVFTCLVCATFVTFYGIQFADSTCQKWISSMLISFFSSVLVTQPLKVFLLAIILSLIFKKLKVEVSVSVPGTVDQGQTTTKEGEAKKKKRWVFASDGDYVGLEDDKTNGKGQCSKNNKPKQPGCTPLEGEALTAARARRLKELEMWRVVREIVIYVVFVTILLFVSYRDRLSNTFLYKDTMRRVFVANDVSNFEEVSNTKEYWEWARTGFLNGIRAGPYYNDLPPLMLRGYVNDKASKLLGYATMRQLRVKPRQCKVVKPMVGVVEECNTDYEYLNQEEGTFDLGWQPRTTTSTANDTAEWYRYTSSDELDSYPYWGELALYAGGGYVVRLEGSKSELLNLFTRLETEQWIDQYTRAVFIEFVIYNAQVNLFGIARILAEFQPNGGVVPSYRFEPANLLPYATGFWNLVELGIVSMSVAAVVLFFYRLFETNQQMEKFHENNGVGFINFQYVGYWSEVFGYMLAWIVFLSVLKFLRLLRFNRRMSLLSSTLRACANGLLQLSLVFWIVFLAFAMLFFLTFMTIDDRYSSFIGSVVANILMIMGKFSVGTLMSAEPLLTQTYVFFYAVTLTFIILNMFVTVLNEGFGSVRADLTKQQNDYEIVDFMLSRLKGFFGVSNAQNLQNPEDDQEEAVEALTAVEKLPDRVDRLLSCLCRQFPEKSDALLQKLVATPSVSFHAAMKKVRALNRLNARRAAEAEAREKQKLSVIRLSSRKTKPAAPLAADKKEAPVPKPSAFGPTKKSNSRGGVTNRRGRGPVPRTNTSSTSGVAGRTKKEAAPHNTSVV
ncbi:hypothetical protein BaRGS_00003407 [Batillaria attramentaria]|uniref:PLAT domain-containing protein n=1 Tax=Batillaria attramentaria TaxID=370345 RepID=A0ABD0M134_9CAEN